MNIAHILVIEIDGYMSYIVATSLGNASGSHLSSRGELSGVLGAQPVRKTGALSSARQMGEMGMWHQTWPNTLRETNITMEHCHFFG